MAENEFDTDTSSAPGSPRGGRTMQMAVIALLMAGEGVAVFFVANAMNPGPPQAVAAEGSDTQENAGPDAEELAEVELAQCKPSNKMSGKLIAFQLRVSALVKAGELEHVQQEAESKKARIRDRINFVIRSAAPKHLNEPGLETIKRRIKNELDRVFDDPELVQEVLIPEILQSTSGI